MKQPDKFPFKQFRNAMLVASKVKKQLQPFINELNKGNIYWMFAAISQLQRIFASSHQDIQIKFSSIYVVKFFFDTGSVELINLIQAYLLQHIEKIASYKANVHDQQKGIKYFKDLGYPNDHKQIEKFGYNYLRLAIELAIVAAKIKPKKLYENQPMRSDSQYALALIRLLNKGLKPYDDLAFYKESAIEELKSKFKANLATYKDKSQNYANYFLKCADIYLKSGKSEDQVSDFKKVLMTGDLLVTTDIIGLCSQSLGSQSFVKRKNAVLLINDFLQWGDAQAYIVINEDNFVEQIADHIQKLKVEDVSLERGKRIYPEIKGQEGAKNEFYVQFLKCIQNWGTFFQKDLINPSNQSRVRQIFINLKQKKKLQFPQNKGLQKFLSQATEAFSKNKERTNRIIEQCSVNELAQQSKLHFNVQSSTGKSVQNKKQGQSSMQKQLKKRQNPSSITPADTPYENAGVNYQGFMKAIKNTNLQIQAIPKNQADAQKRIDYLISFRQNFEANIQDMDQSQQQKIQQVMDQGFKVVDKISQIETVFKKYKDKKTTWKHVCCVVNGVPYAPQLEIKNNMPSPSSKIQSNLKSEQKIQSKSNIKIQIQPPFKPLNPKQQIQATYNIHLHKNQEIPNKKVSDSKRKFESQIKVQPKFVKEPYRSDLKDDINSEKTSKIGSIKQKSNIGSSSVDALEIQGDLKSKYVQTNRDKITKTFQTEKQTLPLVRQKSKSIEQRDSSKKIKHSQAIQQSPSRQHIKTPKQQFSISMSNDMRNQFQRQSSRIRNEELNQNVEIMPGVLNGNGPSKENLSFSPSQYQKSKVRQQRNQNIYQEHHLQSAVSQNLRKINLNIKLPSQAEAKQMADLWDGQMDQFDQIQEPDLKPLNDSYHDIRQLQNKIKNDPAPSFKSCFQSNQYLITSNKNTKKIQKMFWLEKDTANLFKPSKLNSSVNSANKPSRISIPQLLYERSNKYNEDLNKIDREKTKHIHILQDKIKQLESQGKNLKQIVVVQQRQLKVMTQLYDDDAISRNQINKHNYLEDQNHLFKSKIRVANQSVKFTPNKSSYLVSLKNGQDPNSSYSPERALSQLGKLISMSAFSQYLTIYEKSQKTKRSLLKHKELACQDGFVEIGWMTSRTNNKLQIVYYITAQGLDIQNLQVRIQKFSNKKLDIRYQPQLIRHIGIKKQQKVIFDIQITEIPYKLPSIQLFYTQNAKSIQKKFFLPCSFNKFVQTKPASRVDLEKAFQTNQQKIKRGQQVPYSKLILKDLNRITDYIPNISTFNGGTPNQHHQIVYGGMGRFGMQEFFFKLCIKPNQFLYIQGLNTSKKSNGALQYFICTITNLLMKEISWKN